MLQLPRAEAEQRPPEGVVSSATASLAAKPLRALAGRKDITGAVPARPSPDRADIFNFHAEINVRADRAGH